MKDIYHNLNVSQVANPAVATDTVTSSAIDMLGYQSLAVIFSVGNSADTLSGSLYWTLKLTECDTSGGSYTDVALANLHNSAATYVIDAPSEDTLAVKFGYKGSKRFVKAVATATGSHSSGTPMAILALRGHPTDAPVA